MIQTTLYVVAVVLLLIITSVASYGIGKADGVAQAQKEKSE